MKNPRLQRLLLAAFLFLAGLTAVLWAVGYYGHVSISTELLLNLWRAATIAFIGYSC